MMRFRKRYNKSAKIFIAVKERNLREPTQIQPAVLIRKELALAGCGSVVLFLARFTEFPTLFSSHEIYP